MKVAFSQTIKPLLLAPLAGLVILVAIAVRSSGAAALTLAPVLALRMAPFCYGALAVFAVPALVLAPGLRQPSYWGAAAWGALSAVVAFALVGWYLGQRIQISSDTLALFAAGGASGSLYAFVAGRSGRA